MQGIYSNDWLTSLNPYFWSYSSLVEKGVIEETSKTFDIQ